jgi:rhodanese-related sulfurtransferase
MSSDALTALAGVPNACEALPNLITGGQPSAEQLEKFKTAGGGVILDIRDPMEARPFDEPARTGQLGLHYVNVAISPGATGDAKMEQILAALRTNADKVVFFHCGSGNRVGGAMIAYLMLEQSVPEDEAVERAMRIGLRSPEYMEWGLDYAHRHANKS